MYSAAKYSVIMPVHMILERGGAKRRKVFNSQGTSRIASGSCCIATCAINIMTRYAAHLTNKCELIQVLYKQPINIIIGRVHSNPSLCNVSIQI